MNNIFRILWFEDKPTWSRAGKKKVEKILANNYLISHIDIKQTSKGINISNLLSNQYDLILMDYELKDGFTGDNIINSIRKNNFLTDILFYSSNFDHMLAAVRKAIPEVDGIYLAKRDNELFFEKLERLINKIIKRSEDITSLRGTVMDCTSDFEEKIKNFLDEIWKSEKNNRKNLLQSILIDKIFPNKLKRITKSIEEVKNMPSFLEINDDPYYLSMADRLDILDELAKSENIAMIDDNQNIKSYYMSNLGSYRNKLGHVKNNESIRVNGKTIILNEEFHKTIRKNILEINSVIKDLPQKFELESVENNQ